MSVWQVPWLVLYFRMHWNGEINSSALSLSVAQWLICYENGKYLGRVHQDASLRVKSELQIFENWYC